MRMRAVTVKLMGIYNLLAYAVSLNCVSVYMQKKEASIKYFNVLEEMRREELKLQEAAEARRRHEAELKLHKVIFFFYCLMCLLNCIHAMCHLRIIFFLTGSLCGVA